MLPLFTDHKVFKGMIPPVKDSQLVSETDMIVTASKESATKKTPQELAQEKKCPKFPRWEKVLYPSQPVAVTGEPPCPSRSPEQTYLLEAACNWPTKKVPTKTPSPTQGLEVAHQ